MNYERAANLSRNKVITFKSTSNDLFANLFSSLWLNAILSTQALLINSCYVRMKSPRRKLLNLFLADFVKTVKKLFKLYFVNNGF